MRISAKGEYSIKAMLDLALHHGKGLIPIQDIAARQAIPPRYLEQVLLLLKRAGFLQSKRGSAGGYQLARPPREISVGAVLSAMEGSLERSEAGQRAGRRGGSDPPPRPAEVRGQSAAAGGGGPPGGPGVAASVLELVGIPPLVRLNKLPKPGGATILGKLESLNPGGSVKDRIAISMIGDAERRGLLPPGSTLVAPARGDT